MHENRVGLCDVSASVVDAALIYQIEDGVFLDVEYVIEALEGTHRSEDQAELYRLALEASQKGLEYIHLYC